MMVPAYIVDVVRTPVGKYGGALSRVRPDDLLAHVIRALVRRNGSVDWQELEDVIAGDANQAGEDNRNVARMAALLAGLPPTVPGNTVNRLCASGMQAIMDGSRAIMCGDGDLFIASGVESMSRAPYVMLRPEGAPKPGAITHAANPKPAAGTDPGRLQGARAAADDVDRPSPLSAEAWQAQAGQIADSTIGWRFPNRQLTDRYYPYSMGETAENLARLAGISRQEQDEFALASHEKYFAAYDGGKFSEEIEPVELVSRDGASRWCREDEPPRRHLTMARLAALKPAFAGDGTVTAGNASGLSDGAAAMLLAGPGALQRYGLRPLARVVSMAVSGIDPAIMGLGPVRAVQKALQRARLSIDDIGLVELNEAFACQSIACIRELKLDPARVNVNGGALAIGNPLGCIGVRISATLLYEMRRRGVRYGLATMCVGLGQGAAMIFELASDRNLTGI